MFLAYFNILTQSIAITYSMFNFGKFLTKNAITFDLTEIDFFLDFVGIKFVAYPMMPSKMPKSQARNHLFRKYFGQNRHFSKKYRF